MIRSLLARYLDDLMAIGGLLLLAYGASLLHPAAGWIVLGLGLLAVARWGRPT